MRTLDDVLTALNAAVHTTFVLVMILACVDPGAYYMKF